LNSFFNNEFSILIVSRPNKSSIFTSLICPTFKSSGTVIRKL
jgi:hypothetical protein